MSTSANLRNLETLPLDLDESLLGSVGYPSLPDDGDRATTTPRSALAETASRNLSPRTLQHVPLTYRLSPELLRQARLKTAPSDTVYWRHDLYQGSDDEPVKLHYCRNTETAERVAALFLHDRVLGFDLEWKAQALIKDGIRKNVALIQLANESRVALFHVALFREGEDATRLIPSTLKKILESPEITKVGIAIKADATRLRNFLGLDPQGLFELSHLHKLVKYSVDDPRKVNKKLVSLAEQAEEHFHMPIWKGDDVRSSDWTKPLQMQQLQYAASDAYAVLHLHDILERKRRRMDPTPPCPAHAELNLPIRLASGVAVPATDDVSIELAVHVGAAPPLETVPMETRPNPRGSSTSSMPRAPKNPLVQQADTWALEYRATVHPPEVVRALPAQLRAYALWYRYEHSVEEIARTLRDPPLQMTTVGNYIVEAIRLEKSLAYDRDRLQEVLEHVPASRKKPYQHLLFSVRTHALRSR